MHLCAWAGDAVALVTAGRSRAEWLAANATMLELAGVRLRSVVLLDSSDDDDTLGVIGESQANEPDVRARVRLAGPTSAAGMP
jgi:hypothetical protein